MNQIELDGLTFRDCNEIIRMINRRKAEIIAVRMQKLTREIAVLEKEVARREEE